ncbi:MAG: polymer-forming cytoskeletal protein, partial [Acidobacteriota bacterium]
MRWMHRCLDNRRGWLLVAACVVSLLLATSALADQAEPTGSDLTTTETAALLEALNDDFEVIPLRDGYLLVPSSENARYRSIEVFPGGVEIDRRQVSRASLIDTVGDDLAGSILRLAGLSNAGDAPATTESAEAAASAEATASAESSEPAAADDEAPPVEQVVVERNLIDIEESGAQVETTLGERDEADLDTDAAEVRSVVRTRRSDARVSVGGYQYIEANESVEAAVVIGGSLEIDGEVRGDAVAVGGSVSVDGDVDGTVVSVGGSVELGPEAHVHDDVVSVGGRVRAHPEAIIDGEITEVSVSPLVGDWDWGFGNWDLRPGGWFAFGWGDVFDLASNAIALLVLALLFTLILRRFVEGASATVSDNPFGAFTVGLVALIAVSTVFPVVLFVLTVSVIGIPVVILLTPIVVLALLAALILGYAASAHAIGRMASRRLGTELPGALMLVLLGVILIQSVSILGEVMSIFGWPLGLVAFALILFGFLLKAGAWITGFGALLIHLANERNRRRAAREVTWDQPVAATAPVATPYAGWGEPETGAGTAPVPSVTPMDGDSRAWSDE